MSKCWAIIFIFWCIFIIDNIRTTPQYKNIVLPYGVRTPPLRVEATYTSLQTVSNFISHLIQHLPRRCDWIQIVFSFGLANVGLYTVSKKRTAITFWNNFNNLGFILTIQFFSQRIGYIGSQHLTAFVTLKNARWVRSQILLSHTLQEVPETSAFLHVGYGNRPTPTNHQRLQSRNSKSLNIITLTNCGLATQSSQKLK